MNEIRDRLKLNTLETCMQQVQKDINEIKEMLKSFDNKFVSQQEFYPIRTIVYGIVAIVLTTVFSAVIYLVIKT